MLWIFWKEKDKQDFLDSLGEEEREEFLEEVERNDGVVYVIDDRTSIEKGIYNLNEN